MSKSRKSPWRPAKLWFVVVIAGLTGTSSASAQDVRLFTTDFPAEEFELRREGVYDAIGNNAVALIAGAPSPAGYTRFRQSNNFYYLCGVESPHAYLLLDGRTRRTNLYLPHRNPRREASEGRLLAAEDVDELRGFSGVDEVHGVDLMSEHLARIAWGRSLPTLYVPHKPAEMAAMSRDLATRANSDIANDPWDNRQSREAQFLEQLRSRFPALEIQDLSPVLDSLRLVKSEREIALIRKATRLSGLALMESMRSTSVGILERELDAVAKFIFHRHGAQNDAYYSLIASGVNAWYPHYHKGSRIMRDGDFLLMDYAPDVGYYTSDVTRMWPVNGKFNDWQRDLYGFYLAYYRAILDSIRPGDVNAVMKEAAGKMETILKNWKFTKPHFRSAAESFVAQYRERANRRPASLGHGVGMAVHDVGDHDGMLVPGMVFTIEPQFRIPEERIYIRLEDVLLITTAGAENLSNFVPMDIDAIEALMAEPGMLEQHPKLVH